MGVGTFFPHSVHNFLHTRLEGARLEGGGDARRVEADDVGAGVKGAREAGQAQNTRAVIGDATRVQVEALRCLV